jgi:methyl-accepting chemotaxis protein
MKIRQKLLLGATALTLVPLVLMATLLWQGATSLSGQAVGGLVETQLQSLRDLKTQQVREELDSRLGALRALGQNRATLDAMQRLREGFHSAARELPQFSDTGALHQSMQDYVNTAFNPEFKRRNPGTAPDLSALIRARSANAAVLQHAFISTNPNPLGKKEKLTSTELKFSYAEAHAHFHPTLERAQKLLGFYDLFLIDTSTDEVIYTVFKELDFGSRLSDGIAAKTKLAEAYARVKNAKSRDDFYLSDFEPYLASYNDQAAFAAVPLFEGERQIGVLAMQYPIDKINAAMSSGNTWAQIGLGATGDVFLVGADYNMRTNARYLTEVSQQKAYFSQLQGKLDAQRLALLRAKNSTIGVVRIESDATRAAMAGKTGLLRFVDYRDVPVIGAFAPLQVAGQNWAVVAKIDAAEADAPLHALSRSVLLRSVLVALAVLVAVGALMTLFLRRFIQPITQLHGAVTAVAAGNMAARSQLSQPDEIGELGRAFDQLLDERISSLNQAAQENEALNNSVIGLLQTVFRLSEKDLTARAEVSEDVIGTLASSINQLTDETAHTLAEVRGIAGQVRQAAESVNSQAQQVSQTNQAEHQSLERMAGSLHQATDQLREVAKLSENSSRVAEQASGATETALRSVAATVRGMDQLREAISEAEKRFKRLGERSQEISSVVTLIGTIAERTHMLAINAAMQAATAGEAGKGFTVVAEEVQRLSESSRQATQQIGQLVSNIQVETNESVYGMNRLISQVVSQSEQAQQAGEQMSQTRATTAQLVQLVQQIAAFSEQQSQLSQELQVAVQRLDQGSAATQQAIAQQTSDTTALADSARQLTAAVGQFRLPQ